MSEKSRLPSRLHFCLIVMSMFLLVMSSVFLLQFSNGSLTARTMFKLTIVNNTAYHIKPDVKKHLIEAPLPSVIALRTNPVKPVIRKEPISPNANVTKKSSSVKRHKSMAAASTRPRLRVYMYDLPPEFHFGLFGWKGKKNQIWPEINTQIPAYPGGLNLQHSVEYWLTLDLLSSNVPKISRSSSAIRVSNASEADVFFVPFFASLSYNRHSKIHGKEKISVNKRLQESLVQFLTNRDEWKRRNGKNHVIVAHHPNSLLNARNKLGSAIFVLADFGRYPAEVANLNKDIIAPYIHLLPSVPTNASASFRERTTLAYFRGAIYRKAGGVIRQELFYLLKDEKDVYFSFGSIHGNGINLAGNGMAASKFCLHIAGDTPSSNRLFDAIASHCVPVIISDDIELPFEDVLDYSQFCIFVGARDSIEKGYLLNLLRGITEEKWTKMWEKLKEVAHFFEYQNPSQSGDAVDMIWQAVSRKIKSVRFDRHRNERFRRSQLRIVR